MRVEPCALQLLCRLNDRCTPVVDEARQFAGILSRQDIVRTLAASIEQPG